MHWTWQAFGVGRYSHRARPLNSNLTFHLPKPEISVTFANQTKDVKGLSPRGRSNSSRSRRRTRRIWAGVGTGLATFAFRSRRRDSKTSRPNLRQGQSKWDVRPGSARLRFTPFSSGRSKSLAVTPCRPDPANPDQKPLKRLLDPTANGKKRRELYVGNLPQHKAHAPEAVEMQRGLANGPSCKALNVEWLS